MTKNIQISIEKSVRGKSSNLQLVNGDPGVGGEVLEHGDEELETSVPVTDEQHHADEVEDAHEHPSHAQELKR